MASEDVQDEQVPPAYMHSASAAAVQSRATEECRHGREPRLSLSTRRGEVFSRKLEKNLTFKSLHSRSILAFPAGSRLFPFSK